MNEYKLDITQRLLPLPEPSSSVRKDNRNSFDSVLQNSNRVPADKPSYEKDRGLQNNQQQDDISTNTPRNSKEQINNQEKSSEVNEPITDDLKPIKNQNGPTGEHSEDDHQEVDAYGCEVVVAQVSPIAITETEKVESSEVEDENCEEVSIEPMGAKQQSKPTTSVAAENANQKPNLDAPSNQNINKNEQLADQSTELQTINSESVDNGDEHIAQDLSTALAALPEQNDNTDELEKLVKSKSKVRSKQAASNREDQATNKALNDSEETGKPQGDSAQSNPVQSASANVPLEPSANRGPEKSVKERDKSENQHVTTINSESSSVGQKSISEANQELTSIQVIGELHQTTTSNSVADVAKNANGPEIRFGAIPQSLLKQHESPTATKNNSGEINLTDVDRVRMMQRVAKAFHHVGNNEGEMRIRLSPPELGAMKLEVSFRDGVLHARMETETTTARNVIMENLPQLRERLQEQNVRIETFDVDVQNQNQSGNTEQRFADAQDQQKSQNIMRNRLPNDGTRTVRASTTTITRSITQLQNSTQLNVII